jgi:hypothetical protein
MRAARAAGVRVPDLLAAAMPCSWMVNARAASPVFRRWLSRPLASAWCELIELCDGGPDTWLAHGEDARRRVAEIVRSMAIDGHGVAAISKVLALLCPGVVPLMDDAALWLVLDAVPCPRTADAPVAGAEHFVPMLDAFTRAVLDGWDALVPLARDYALAPLDAAQVLDRLLWFDSWGWRLPHGGNDPRAPRWCRVADESGAEAIVRVAGPHPEAAAPGARVDLAQIDDARWLRDARDALTTSHRA